MCAIVNSVNNGNCIKLKLYNFIYQFISLYIFLLYIKLTGLCIKSSSDGHSNIYIYNFVETKKLL